MPGIKDLLHEEYLRPQKAEPKKGPEFSGEEPPPVIKTKRQRSTNDVFLALEAQRVFNPSVPAVPSPQAAPANTFQKGVTPALDTSGPWAGPAPTGER